MNGFVKKFKGEKKGIYGKGIDYDYEESSEKDAIMRSE